MPRRRRARLSRRMYQTSRNTPPATKIMPTIVAAAMDGLMNLGEPLDFFAGILGAGAMGDVGIGLSGFLSVASSSRDASSPGCGAGDCVPEFLFGSPKYTRP